MKISRSEQKRRIKDIEKLVHEIIGMPTPLLHQCPCQDEVRELFVEVQDLKGGARKRTAKYITKLLRDEPLEDLYRFVAEHKGERLQKTKRMHEVEYLRDRLIDEAVERKRECAETGEEWGEFWKSEVAESISAEIEMVEKKTLLRLAYLFVQTRNPKHSREIFRYLLAQKEQSSS